MVVFLSLIEIYIILLLRCCGCVSVLLQARLVTMSGYACHLHHHLNGQLILFLVRLQILQNSFSIKILF